MKLSAPAAMSAAALLALASAATGQTPALGPRAGQFPDIMVSSVGGSYDSFTAAPSSSSGVYNYGTSGGISSYAIGSDSCNLGTHVAIWMDTTVGFKNQHPVIGGELYRLYNGRFEQIGIGWLKHGFCAADSCQTNVAGSRGCANLKPAPNGTCQSDLGVTAGSCDWLGYGRATDTYSADLNGTQGYLGPRSEVNPWTGVFPYPYIRQGTNTVTCLNKRILTPKTEFDPAVYPRYNATTTPAGAQYFAEIVYIVTDEWPNERFNNYSYRRITPGNPGANTTFASNVCSGTGTEQSYQLNFASGDRTIDQKPAIAAWQAADPTVKLQFADAPNDGRFYVGSKVTDLGGGQWQYEYAVFNMNSDRSGQSFSVAKAPAGVTISGQGFRSLPYHSGEPYSSAAWTMSVDPSELRWETQTFAENPNANALRWSMLFNFRFTANVAPKTGPVRIGLFKGPAVTGDAAFVEIPGVDVPGDPPAPPVLVGDFNGQNGIDLLDIFAFLNAWFAGCTGPGDPPCIKSADLNGTNGVDLLDIFFFLNNWFAGT